MPTRTPPVYGEGVARNPDRVGRVRAFLLDLGVPVEEIDRAEEEDSLDLLVVERLLVPSGPTYTPKQAAEASGMTLPHLQRLWRALGFANVDDDDPAFTDLDLEAMRNLEELLDVGIVDFESAVQMARVIGSSMARIADAQLFAARFTDPGREPRDGLHSLDVAMMHVASAGSIMAGVSRLLEYAWRRHSHAAGRRAAYLRSQGTYVLGGVEMAVGFADLVGYTVLSQELEDEELASLVERFDALSHDIVTSLGGRVVKMIGDEAMFVVQEPRQAAEIGLTLSEAYADDELLSDVRVGLAHGRVLLREGDYFGAVVNLASRLVNLAKPGTVLASDEVHSVIGGDDSFCWRRLRARPIKDIGRVDMWVLRRAGDADALTPPKRQDRAWSRPGGRGSSGRSSGRRSSGRESSGRGSSGR